MSKVSLYRMSEAPLFLMSEVPLYRIGEVPRYPMSEVPLYCRVPGFGSRVSGTDFRVSGKTCTGLGALRRGSKRPCRGPTSGRA